MKKQVKFKSIEFQMQIDGKPTDVIAKPYLVSVGKRSIRLCAYVTGVGWRTNNYSRHVNS